MVIDMVHKNNEMMHEYNALTFAIHNAANLCISILHRQKKLNDVFSIII